MVWAANVVGTARRAGLPTTVSSGETTDSQALLLLLGHVRIYPDPIGRLLILVGGLARYIGYSWAKSGYLLG